MTFPIFKRRAFLLAGVILLALAVLAIWLLPELLRVPKAEAALIINGEVITKAEFNEAFQELLNRRRAALTGQERLDFERQLAGAPGAYFQLTLKSKLAEELIRRTLLEQAARQMGIKIEQSELLREVRLQLRRFLEESGVPEEQIRRTLEDPKTYRSPFSQDLKERIYWQLLQDQLRQHIVGDLNPTETELRRYYQQYRLRYYVPELVHVRHILIRVPDDAPEERVKAARARVEQLYELVRKGADFVELAHRYSEDPLSAPNGGDYGWIQRGDPTGEEFVEAAFALQKPGDVSPPVRTKRGFHLIQLLERRPARGETFEEVAAEVRRDYIREKTEQRYQAWYESYRKEAEISIELPLLKAYRLEAQDTKAALHAYEEIREEKLVDDPYLGYYIARLYRLELDEIENRLKEMRPADDKERLQREARILKEKIVLNLKEVLSQVEEREIYEALLEIHPDDVEVHFKFAQFLLDRGRWDEAARELQALLARDPEHPEALLTYGELLMEMKDFARAAEYLERALELYLKSQDERQLKLIMELAQAYQELGEPEKVRNLLHQALQIDPNHTEAKERLGRLYLEQGDPLTAISYLKGALKDQTAEPQLLLLLGQAYLAERDYEEAEKALLKALEAPSPPPAAYLRLSELYQRLKRPQEALRFLRKGFERAVGWDEREELALRILELAPEDTKVRLELAQLYEMRRRYEEAIEQYRTILQYEAVPSVLRRLGDLYLHLARYSEALNSFEEALKLVESPQERAGLWIRVLKVERARSEKTELSQTGLEALYQLAQLHMAMGEFEQAAKYLSDLLHEDPSYREGEVAKLIEKLQKKGVEVAQPKKP